jgi:hypothetical protein
MATTEQYYELSLEPQWREDTRMCVDNPHALLGV